MATDNETIKIDDVDYKMSELSDECRAEIHSLQFTEALIVRLNFELAVAETAKIAYQNAVVTKLPDKESKH